MTTVSEWLSSLNLEQYAPAFDSYSISADDLPFLDSGILKDIGIDKIGDRIRLENALNTLKPSSSQSLQFTTVEQLFAKVQANAKPLRLPSLNSNTSTHQKNLSNTDKSEFKLSNPPNLKDASRSLVSFILQNGSTVRINLNGCFNATSIKKKLIKFLDLPSKIPSNYDAYLTDSLGNLHLLFDVELVTICHSNDRIEKSRILFCLKNELPSSTAIDVSKKFISLEQQEQQRLEQEQREKELADENEDSSTAMSNISNNSQDSKFRTVFGQRPTSQLISTNLQQYFPEESSRKLSQTVRNSVRYTMSHHAPNNRMSTVGDVLMENHNKRLSMLSRSNINVRNSRMDDGDTLDLKSSMKENKQRFSVASSFNEDDSKIELFNIDSDSENDEEGESHGRMVQQVRNVNLSTSGPTNWLKGARIGSGSFGTVYLGMNSTTGELMAVKQVELKPLFEDAVSQQNPKHKQQQKQIHDKIVEALQHEMKLLAEFEHENIVTYLGSNSDDSHLNIFLEYVPGGSLNSMLTNYGPFEEPLIRNFTRQILIGLNYLHSKNIIHRDIKGANILIDLKGEVKISDFGISKKLTPNSTSAGKRASLQGSVYWMAPEVVKQQATTTKADIWSVGCLVIEMFTAKHPFPNFSQMQAIFKIGTHHLPEIPRWCSAPAKQFLEETFRVDYEKRLGAQDLLGSQFMEPLIS
jgi:mitogen-activated protein kinase kinase kinase